MSTHRTGECISEALDGLRERLSRGCGQGRLSLEQNRLIVLEESLQRIFVQERHRGAFHLALVMFVMDQRLADEANFKVRTLHSPDLAALKRLEQDPTLSHLVLH